MSKEGKLTKVWIPKEEIQIFLNSSKRYATHADLLLSDYYQGALSLTKHLKVLLKELCCVVYSNLVHFEDLLGQSESTRDGIEGYVLEQAALTSLSTYAVSFRQIVVELSSLNIALEEQ